MAPPQPPAGSASPGAAETPTQQAAKAASGAGTCPSCGAPMADDQRYCLSCGTRRGAPRVAATQAPASREGQPQPQPQVAPTTPTPTSAQARQADVSPLAAVIGIALLGGMLLIGVLIGRGANDDPPPAPVVQVGEATAGSGGVVASEWPEGTDGFTVQLTAVPKEGATAESVDAATQQAVEDGAIDAAVLDSDLYSSLPPGNYIVYSGVYTDRKSAETALKGLRSDIPAAAVVEVAGDDGGSDASSSVPEIAPPTEGTTPSSPEADAGSATEVVPEAGGEPEVPTGGVTEDQK